MQILMDFISTFRSPIELIVLALIVYTIIRSQHRIGPTEVGLVTKKFSSNKLSKDNPIAFSGEAGYQADLLMPGLRWKWWPLYSVDKYPWGAGAAGRNRRGHCTGGAAAANWRKIRRVSEGVC